MAFAPAARLGYLPPSMFARLEALRDRPWRVALLLAIVAQALFTLHLGRPGVIQFDEIHYVPAARDLIALDMPVNTEHPMVGKELIALGILIFGDEPFGWRIVPSLAGTATLLAIFAFLWLAFRDMRTALVGAVAALLNQLLFVQARIAMLDVFLSAFLLWGMVLMLAAAQGRRVWAYWLGAAVLFGLAVGSKWSAIPYEAAALALFLGVRLWDARRAGKGGAATVRAALAGRGQAHWPGLPAVPALLLFGLVSIAVYCLTFLPAFFYSVDPLTLDSFVDFQLGMYQSQTAVLAHHTYQSEWPSWPLMLRPIWYFYEEEGGAWRGVLLVGNPAILWGGCVAIVACLWAGLRDRAAAPIGFAALWAFSWLIYWAIPKTIGFFYYYYLSSLFVAMALAVAFRQFPPLRRQWIDVMYLWVALALFLYFYPIIAAAPLHDGSGFNHWMWFNGWR